MLPAFATAGLLLASQALGSRLTSPNVRGRSVLEARSGCDQGPCPDTKFGVDLYWGPDQGGNSYFVRWNGACGCSAYLSSEDGCAEFDICTGHHSVCLDWRSGRGHWIDPAGKRTCYGLSAEYSCQDPKQWSAWPVAEVACTW